MKYIIKRYVNLHYHFLVRNVDIETKLKVYLGIKTNELKFCIFESKKKLIEVNENFNKIRDVRSNDESENYILRQEKMEIY